MFNLKISLMLTSNVKKLFFMAVTAVMLFSSCKSTYFQVYDVKSNAMQQQDNSLVYENGDMKVMYNLWADGGSMSFIVQNKTDRDLFLNMGQSFLIYNGEASDYFQNRTYSRMLSNTQAIGYGISQSYSSVGFWPDAYIVPGKKSLFAKIVKGSSSAVTFQEKEILQNRRSKQILLAI